MLLSIVNEELTTPDNTEEQKKNKCKKTTHFQICIISISQKIKIVSMFDFHKVNIYFI